MKAIAGLGIAQALLMGALVTVGYVKGSGDKNTDWLEKENSRIEKEAQAEIKALKTAFDLDVKAERLDAAAIARAQEREAQATQRAKRAEAASYARRKENDELSKQLKEAQDAAAAAGDLSGLAIAPDGVRSQLADRLDKICSRRPSECNKVVRENQGTIQKPASEQPLKPVLAGYPQQGNAQR